MFFSLSAKLLFSSGNHMVSLEFMNLLTYHHLTGPRTPESYLLRPSPTDTGVLSLVSRMALPRRLGRQSSISCVLPATATVFAALSHQRRRRSSQCSQLANYLLVDAGVVSLAFSKRRRWSSQCSPLANYLLLDAGVVSLAFSQRRRRSLCNFFPLANYLLP